MPPLQKLFQQSQQQSKRSFSHKPVYETSTKQAIHNGAKTMLQEHVEYEKIVLGQGATLRSLRAVAGATTVPQVFIDGKRIGGSEELAAYLGA